MNEPAAERINEYLDAVDTAANDVDLTIDAIIERDYQRRVKQLAEWCERAKREREAWAKWEQEVIEFLDSMGW